MKHLVLLFGLLVFSTFQLFSQIQTNEFPASYSNKIANTVRGNASYTFAINKPDLAAIVAEDKKDDLTKEIPWRFGTVIPVDFTVVNSGLWEEDDNNGKSIWKLRLTANDAISINLNFNQFHLPNSAKLFVYNDDYSDILGAVTAANNKTDGQFSIRPIFGEAITLELEVDQNQKKDIQLSIHQMVYGYRDLKQQMQTVFQSSGSCNININCSEGDNWQDIKRSVAMVLRSNNSRICTGALINNVEQDTIPYFLSAAHCSIQNNAIFIFNYESPNCSPNTDGMLSNSISGCTRKAVAANFSTDFDLRLLSSTPPASYNVLYAGWSAVNTPSLNSASIHHPSGDVKKIAIDTDPTTTGSYGNSTNNHWQVGNWDSGTTEPGSSGAPLFNENQQIIGQLHGGNASCSNNAQDYFGKFALSWASNSDTARQLKHWLDPNNTGITVINALDPNTATFNVDLQILNILNVPKYLCDSSISPIFVIKNIGNNTLGSAKILYTLNSGLQDSVVYANPISRNEVVQVAVNNIPVSSNSQLISARVSPPNGSTDQFTTNNLITYSFTTNTSAAPEELVVTLKTDDYGSETSWDLREEATNNVWHKSTSYPNVSGGAIYRDTLCISEGCLRFNLYDSQGDGFNDASGNFGNGYLVVTRGLDTLFFENSFTGTISTDTFCIKLSTGLTSNKLSNTEDGFNVFPNPIQAGEFLNVANNPENITLFDLNGKLILKKFDLGFVIPSELPAGIYFVSARDLKSGKLKVSKLIIR